MWGIKAIRSAQSVLGKGEGWCNSHGVRTEFNTEDEAEAEAFRYNKQTSSGNVYYMAEEIR